MNYDRNPISLFARPKNIVGVDDYDGPFAPFRVRDDPEPEKDRRKSAFNPRVATAEMILRAGRRARGLEADDTAPPAGSLAEKILTAAKKARGEA
jgi:hypothetical protein